jgi:N4-gp56 family major capsid protein
MRRYNRLPSSKVPLGNSGITPPATQLTAVDIDARMSFYGQYIEINEQVTLQAQDPVLNQAVIRLGHALRQTEDELTRDMLASTASFINCSGGHNGDNPSDLSASDLSLVTTTLLGNDARTIMDNMPGEMKIGTAPVRNTFMAMCHTDITDDFDNLDAFIHNSAYPSQQNVLPSEYGTFKNIRVMVSSLGSNVPNASLLANKVYNVFCVGMEAYACIKMDNYHATFIYRPPIYSGPLAMNCTVGYKFAEVPRITNDLWLINLRATHS